jgi:hypothetical protein
MVEKKMRSALGLTRTRGTACCRNASVATWNLLKLDLIQGPGEDELLGIGKYA